MGLDAAAENLCIQARDAEWLIRIRLFHVLAETNQTMCTMLLRNHGRHRFCELLFVLDILKDKNNSPAFIDRNSFSERTSYWLIESFLPYQKIAISSGVVEFGTVLALQQKLFCCLEVGVLLWAHVFMMTNFPLLSKSYLI